MRTALLSCLATAMFVATVASCVQPGPNDGEGGSVSTACDNRSDCAACDSCAQNNICQQQVAACQQSSACIALDICFSSCTGNCDYCLAGNQDGVAAYDAFLQCVYCGACPSDCAGLVQCS